LRSPGPSEPFHFSKTPNLHSPVRVRDHARLCLGSSKDAIPADVGHVSDRRRLPAPRLAPLRESVLSSSRGFALAAVRRSHVYLPRSCSGHAPNGIAASRRVRLPNWGRTCFAGWSYRSYWLPDCAARRGRLPTRPIPTTCSAASYAPTIPTAIRRSTPTTPRAIEPPSRPRCCPRNRRRCPTRRRPTRTRPRPTIRA